MNGAAQLTVGHAERCAYRRVRAQLTQSGVEGREHGVILNNAVVSACAGRVIGSKDGTRGFADMDCRPLFRKLIHIDISDMRLRCEECEDKKRKNKVEPPMAMAKAGTILKNDPNRERFREISGRRARRALSKVERSIRCSCRCRA